MYFDGSFPFVSPGALVYRVFPPADSAMKGKLKLLHAATMAVVFILVVIALQVGKIVFAFMKIKHIYQSYN